jgi:hypothetical protein
VARLRGFEPPTSGSGDQRSIQLSYRRAAIRCLFYNYLRELYSGFSASIHGEWISINSPSTRLLTVTVIKATTELLRPQTKTRSTFYVLP